jgi:hypothetical protein
MEPTMYRQNVAISPLAKACKAAALLLILSGVLGLLAHSIVLDSRSGLVAVGATPDVR